MNDNRREFLKKMAQGTIYAVPLIHTLAAPAGLSGEGVNEGTVKTCSGSQGQGQGNEYGKCGNLGNDDGNGKGQGNQNIEGLGTSGFGVEAPWARPPGG